MAQAIDTSGNNARKSIYRTAIILSLLTAFEFLIAFTWELLPGPLGLEVETVRTFKNLLYIILTIFKAFYIIAEFMHLKHEVKTLMYSVMIPFLFIVWLIIGMIIEGAYYGRITLEAYG
ncbi:MAG: cytochrome C oxidase subunit IV family protein [Bacteroidota bacterium]